jgi:hypothetical protein
LAVSRVLKMAVGCVARLSRSHESRPAPCRPHDRFSGSVTSRRAIAMATKRSPGSAGIGSAADDRVRPNSAVRLRRTAPGARRSHSRRAIVPMCREPAIPTATFRSSGSGSRPRRPASPIAQRSAQSGRAGVRSAQAFVGVRSGVCDPLAAQGDRAIRAARCRAAEAEGGRRRPGPRLACDAAPSRFSPPRASRACGPSAGRCPCADRRQAPPRGRLVPRPLA